MKMIFMHVGVLVFSFLENKHNNKKEKKLLSYKDGIMI